MEQYAHLLISSDPNFVPEPAQIEAFFNLILLSFSFEITVVPPFQPGLIVRTPSATPRIARNPLTGETRSFPSSDRTKLEKPSEIPQAIEKSPHVTISASGRWPSYKSPILLITTDEAPFKDDYLCAARCNLRPDTVCTSDKWVDSGEGEIRFDDPNGPKDTVGIFTNPWTGKHIEVPGGGFARFWVEFEFGKWLFPDLTAGFNLLHPDLVAATERCFGLPLIQAGRLL